MRFQTPTLLSLLVPATLAADQQIPLREKAAGWLDKAKAYIPSAIPSLAVPNPIDAGASKIAELKVEKINIRNFERKLGPKVEGEEEWLIYLTGGNKTCFGRCGPSDLIWNQSVPLLTALPRYKDSTLRLGTLHCDHEEVLCAAWAAAVPAIWHFIFPQQPAPTTLTANPAQPSSPLHEIRLNMTTLRTSDIASIPRASKATYLDVEEYTGFLHPVDGMLRKLGLLKPFGYVLYGFGSTPSWLIMVGISFFSRQYMSRRTAARMDNRPRAAPAAAGRT